MKKCKIWDCWRATPHSRLEYCEDHLFLKDTGKTKVANNTALSRSKSFGDRIFAKPKKKKQTKNYYICVLCDSPFRTNKKNENVCYLCRQSYAFRKFKKLMETMK